MDLVRARWLEPVLAATSLAGLHKVFGEAVRDMGFRHFIYRGRFPWMGGGRGEVCVDGFPVEWRQYYIDHHMDARSDPIRQRALRQITPVLWHEVLPKHPRLYRDAREFGLVTGVTCPLHAPGGEWGAISLVSDRGGPHAERDSCAAMAEGQLLACFVHETATRVVRQGSPSEDGTRVPVRAPRITRRERDCLLWAAAGKTDVEIGVLLGISRRTVCFHLVNARRKLGAGNLRHAISRAIVLGLVVPG